MLTLSEIHKGIEANLQALDDLVARVQEAGNKAATTENVYKVAYAKTRLSIRALSSERLTVEQVEAEATVATEKENLDYLIAQNHLMTVREALRATQSKLDAYRSLGASYRSAGG